MNYSYQNLSIYEFILLTTMIKKIQLLVTENKKKEEEAMIALIDS